MSRSDILDEKFLSRTEKMRRLVKAATQVQPAIIDSDADRKLFYKVAKELGMRARVVKMRRAWLGCAIDAD